MIITKNKTKLVNIAIVAFWVMAVVFTSYSFAAQRVLVCDYVSINGDFQSYNVFRRVLAGQTPYVDFSNYIGMAPIFVNILFVAIKNTFANSLFVTNFTANIIFCVAVFMLLKLITNNLGFSCVVSAVIPKLIASQILFKLLGQKYGFIFTERFKGLYTPSNSMRGTRSFLPFLIIIFIFLFKIIYQKITKKELKYIDVINKISFIVSIGLLQGFFVVWSNDFGLACIAAALVVLLFLQIFYYKDKFVVFIRNILLYLLSSAAGLLVSATIITKGQPFAWLSVVKQTAEYQFFYFNGSFMPLLKYIFTNKALWIYTAIFIVVLVYYLYKLIKHKISDTDIALVFLILSIVAGTFAYICSGSGYNFKEALEVYAILTVIGFAAKFVLYALKKYTKIISVVMLASLFLMQAYFGLVAYKSYKMQPSGTYIQELGGTTTLTNALVDAKELIGDEKVFSTYATGLEVVTNQFQPSGYDYIIHCLGDNAHKRYLQQFKSSNCEFVQTPSMDVGVWLANENWYFYREFIGNYEKVYKTEYSWIWQQANIEKINADVDITVTRLNDSQVYITLTSDNKSDFIADLNVDYDVEFVNAFDSFLSLGRSCMVASTNVCFDSDAYTGIAYPACSQEYVPVKMINGKGEVLLTAQYGNGLSLDVNSVQYVGALPPFYLN